MACLKAHSLSDLRVSAAIQMGLLNMAFKTELCPAYEEAQDCPQGTLLPAALSEDARQLALCTLGSFEGTHNQDAVSFSHSLIPHAHGTPAPALLQQTSIAFLCCALFCAFLHQNSERSMHV